MTGRPRHRPRKRFAQHFLAPAWARKVVAAIAPSPDDIFLEIGPGTGAITLPLAASGAQMLAVEIDRELAADLAGRVPPHVTVMAADALRTDIVPFLTGLEPQRAADAPAEGGRRQFRIVGNLPYNLSTPILFRLIDWHRQYGLFADATLMVQREVAQRLAAAPGTADYGVLGISAQVHARITPMLELPPGAFSPPPKVRSSVIRLEFGPPAVRVTDERLFDALIRGLFSQRRKTLLNALRRFEPAAGGALLEGIALDPGRRPGTLTLNELGRLADAVAAVRRPGVL